MKKLTGFVLALVVLLAQAQPQLAGGERVLDFAADIRIAADGTLTVTERIEVQVEGQQIKRGILRDFPTEYQDRRGNRVRVPFEVLGVRQDGRAARWQLEPMANGVRIRIGDPAVMLSHGVHVYEITYRTSRQLGFFETHDELYWNVNGTGWTFAFDRVSAEVSLPQPVPASRLRVEAYTGRQGERGRDYEATARDGGAIFRTTRRLQPSEGLTIVVAFPKGIVAAPGITDRVRRIIEKHAAIPALSAGLVFLLAFLGWRWIRVGRDPRSAPVYPRYDPPEGLGPAGVRYLRQMSYDHRCSVAALLGAAQRGHIRIRQRGESYTLERPQNDASAPWFPGEKEMVHGLLPAPGSSITISRTRDPNVGVALDEFRKNVPAYVRERALYSWNIGSIGLGVIIAVGSVALALYVDPHFRNMALDHFMRVLIGIILFGIGLLLVYRDQEFREKVFYYLVDYFSGTLLRILRQRAVIVVPIGAAIVLMMIKPDSSLAIALLALMVVVLILFARWMPAYTREGRKLMDEIEGLLLYLKVAEADELSRMKAPPPTKEEYARLLPYAVALDVEKNWSARFAAILGLAALAAAVSDFYSHDSGGSGSSHDSSGSGPSTSSSTEDFASGLSSLGDTIAAASTPPGSFSGLSGDGGGFSSDGGGSSGGGSSGGGSSGGGGGGGGGSGW